MSLFGFVSPGLGQVPRPTQPIQRARRVPPRDGRLPCLRFRRPQPCTPCSAFESVQEARGQIFFSFRGKVNRLIPLILFLGPTYLLSKYQIQHNFRSDGCTSSTWLRAERQPDRSKADFPRRGWSRCRVKKHLESPDRSAFGGPVRGRLSLPQCANRQTDPREGRPVLCRAPWLPVGRLLSTGPCAPQHGQHKWCSEAPPPSRLCISLTRKPGVPVMACC